MLGHAFPGSYISGPGRAMTLLASGSGPCQSILESLVVFEFFRGTCFCVAEGILCDTKTLRPVNLAGRATTGPSLGENESTKRKRTDPQKLEVKKTKTNPISWEVTSYTKRIQNHQKPNKTTKKPQTTTNKPQKT